MLRKSFALLQKVGKSLMLPVSVLPAAGLLLGIGKANLLPGPLAPISELMAVAGEAVFGNLPLLFAIGVALGLTANDGVAALAATVGYCVMLSSLGMVAGLRGLELQSVMGIKTLNTGVFGGILIGILAAYLFNRYYRIELPPYLGFFAGKRFVPIATAFSAVVVGMALSVIWPPVGVAIRIFSDWAARENPATAVFLYGVVERLLLPFGLHHIWNTPFFMEMGSYVKASGEVVRGDMPRFFAGDPTAGILAGGFLFKMFGLPLAAIAMWHSARPERRQEIKGMMTSAALTSFLTGITEPIEFAFMFAAPLLYVAHAVLVGFCFLILEVLGCRMGFSFSQGFIDFLVCFKLDTRPWLVLLIGPVVGAVYYLLFRVAIRTFDLKTPGREVDDLGSAGVASRGSELSAAVVEALGGRENIVSLDACITRLRVGLNDPARASAERLKALGAAGVVQVGSGLQAIFGTRSENLKTDIQEFLAQGGAPVGAASAPSAQLEAGPQVRVDAQVVEHLLAALGGPENIQALASCAHSRLRVELRGGGLDRQRLEQAGVRALMEVSPGVYHLVVGDGAVALARAAREALV